MQKNLIKKTFAALLMTGAALGVAQSSSFAATTSISEQISEIMHSASDMADPLNVGHNLKTYKGWSEKFSEIARSSKMGKKEKRSRLLGITNATSTKLTEHASYMTADQLKERRQKLATAVSHIDRNEFEAAAKLGDEVTAEFAKAGI